MKLAGVFVHNIYHIKENPLKKLQNILCILLFKSSKNSKLQKVRGQERQISFVCKSLIRQL